MCSYGTVACSTPFDTSTPALLTLKQAASAITLAATAQCQSLPRHKQVLEIVVNEALRAHHHITFKVVGSVVIAALRCLPRHRCNLAVDELKLNVKPPHQYDNISPFDSELIHSIEGIVQNRDGNKLHQLWGGLPGLAWHLHTDLTTGLPIDNVSDPSDHNVAQRKLLFGENAYPRRASKSFFGFLWEACCDTALIIQPQFCSNSSGSRHCHKQLQAIDTIPTLVPRKKQHPSACCEMWPGGHSAHTRRCSGRHCTVEHRRSSSRYGLLIQGQSLAIDKSSFTGESDYYLPNPQEDAFLRSGSKIQDGYGSMLVTAIGTDTEWGHMMALLSNNSIEEQTPLQLRLTKAATFIGKVGLSVAVLVLVILFIFYFTGHSSSNGDPKFQAGKTSSTQVMDALVHVFSIVVTIVVVAVPEGLPLAVTLTLAYSMRKMMADNALVRKLAACETMGSATTVCSDNTGTLTLNQMTVVKSWVAGKIHTCTGAAMSTLPGQLRSLLFQAIAQNSMGSVFIPKASFVHDIGANEQTKTKLEVTGSPTEKALLWWGFGAGMDFHEVRAESTILQVETFNSAKKRAGVVVKTSEQHVLIHWKGAAEIILSMCNKWVDVEKDAAIEKLITMEKRQDFEAMIEDMASCSLRCVAFSYYDMTQECSMQERDEVVKGRLPEVNLTLLAVVGMKDPCRPEVKSAVKAVKAAGVTVRMVTGDNLATAKAIAKECGILETSEQMAVEGATLRGWTEIERQEKLPKWWLWQGLCLRTSSC